MQSTKKVPARREDGAAPPCEETVCTGSPAAQQNIPQQVITERVVMLYESRFMSIVSFSSCSGLSDLSSFLIAFYHFFPSSFFISLSLPTSCCCFSSPVLPFHPSLFPINCCFLYLVVSHLLLLQTEMEEDPQNKENKVKQGNQVTHSFPRRLIIPSQELRCL